MSAALQWELDWIDNNVHRYDSPLHAESVKRNIEKRYHIKDLQQEIRVLKDTDKKDPPWGH